jgi:beta-galactosidase/beta-glucuronidase
MLRELQNFLARLYGIEPPVDVHDFLITDARQARDLEGEGSREVEEKLLVVEDAGELHVVLYLDAALLERLEARDPLAQLGAANLDDFCKVLEGLSHFNYLTWNAIADRSVTLLELELQAEIDKYLGARTLATHQSQPELAGRLLAVMFDSPRFHATLSARERERYSHAARFAGWYCRSLEARYACGLPGGDMLQELRTFYRLPQPAKLSHIHRAAYA